MKFATCKDIESNRSNCPMEHLVGSIPTDARMISQFKGCIHSLGNSLYTFKELWKRAPEDIEMSSGQKEFCGGRDGSLIATYELMHESSSHVINLYNTRMALVHTYEITTRCEGIYVYVAPSDFVYVLTSRGELYTFFGGAQVRQKQLFVDEKTKIGVRAAAFYQNGFVFMNEKSYDLYWCRDFEQPVLLYEGLDCNTSDMAVIPHTCTASKKPIVFVTDFEQNLVIINDGTINKIDGPALQFALSPDYTKLAARLKNEVEDVVLLITLAKPTESCSVSLADFEIDTACQLAWCGTDFVVVAFDGQLVLVNFGCDPEPLVLDQETNNPAELLVLVPCSDCCLIVTDDAVHKMEILRTDINCAISSPLECLSARLIEACVEKSTTKLMELASDPKNLLNAVKECLRAALQADDERLQKLFFMSAVYGKSFLGIGVHDGLVPKDMEGLSGETASVAQALRVSNAFRTQLSMYVSPKEVEDLRKCTDNLLLRICDRYQFSLALEVADYLNADKHVIFTEWCFARSEKIPPDDVVKEISAKRNGSFDIVEIIRTFSERGKSNIADALLKDEKLKARIVPYYMEKNDWNRAVDTAILSGDSNLFVGVIQEAQSHWNANDINEIRKRLRESTTGYATISKFVSHNKDHQLYELLRDPDQKSSDKNDSEVEFDFWQSLYDARHASEDRVIPTERLNILAENSRKTSWTSMSKALSFIAKDVAVRRTGMRYNVDMPFSLIVQELIRDMKLSDAKQLCKETYGEEKYYHILGQVLAKKSFDEFRQLTAIEYEKFWRYYFLLCYMKFGKDKAKQFAEGLPKKNSPLLQALEGKEQNHDIKSLFAEMEIK